MNKRIRKTIDIIKTFFFKMNVNHIDIYTASTTYFMFISIIPFFLAVVSIIPLTPMTSEDLIEFLYMIVPEDFQRVTASIVNELYGMQLPIMSISIVIALISASNGILSIRKGLDEIVGESRNSGFVLLRAKSLLYTFLMVIIMIVLLTLGGFGRSLVNLVISFVPTFGISFRPMLNLSFLWFLIFAFLFFLIMYSFLPHNKQRVRSQIPGALIASFGWFLVSKAFSIYVSHASFLTMYGSLASVVIFLLWLYIDMYILFTGAQINSFINDNENAINAIINNDI
ncbi:MAG: YihY/virulence factor BrkB family protein [Lachnospiraceae bacterium]|nr:YihY/virulence factor BrkB family protein [Lachnospiraceae bacterium]